MSNLIDQKSESEESGEDSVDHILNLRPKIVAKRRLKGINSNSPTKTDSFDNVIEDKKPENAGKLWEETTVMRSLEEKLVSGNASSIAQLRDRGVETYALDLGKKNFNIKNRKRRCTDDIYDTLMKQEGEDLNDKEAKFEVMRSNFGVMWTLLQKKFHSKVNIDGAQEERIINGLNILVNLEINSKSNKGNSFHRQNFLPRRLVTEYYEKDKLFGTMLDPENMEMEQLANQLAEALGEKEPVLIRKAVELAGKQVSVEIFKKCQDVEKQGGMLTKKEDRRRTPGGVFMQLFSEREDIKEEQKKELFTLGNKLMKEKRKEFKKRAKEIRKNKNAEATNNLPQDIENKDLPTTSDVFKTDIIKSDIKNENTPEDELKSI
uniref:Phosphorylated adapter RNA export protein n=1 Tax=Meloidogyne incognita TaxID=6306 RepID=A0A914LVX5_MELIC